MTDYIRIGKLEWIGLRDKLSNKLITPKSTYAIKDKGLEGDKMCFTKSSKRQVTLIQSEHLPIIINLSSSLDSDKKDNISSHLKRNLVVSGINIQYLIKKYFRIGEAILYGTGDCKPCKKIENNLGKSTFVGMCGMGGITASIIRSGKINIEDKVELAGTNEEDLLWWVR